MQSESYMGMTKEEMKVTEALAYEMLDSCGLSNTIKFDVIEDLAIKLGFVCVKGDMDDNTDGFILINQNTRKILGVKTQKLIAVNSNRTQPEVRFIVAHELAHYALEGKNLGIYAAREKRHGRSDNENKMDYFAACLLMKRDVFLKQIRNVVALMHLTQEIVDKTDSTEITMQDDEYDELCLALSKAFVVPVEAATRRIKEVAVSVETLVTGARVITLEKGLT